MPTAPPAGRAEYFAAARAILLAEDLSGLRIVRLCRRLGVTSGSFYHHFGSLAGFVAGLVEEWATEQVEITAQDTPAGTAHTGAGPAATSPPDTGTPTGTGAAALAARFADTAPHGLEAVIRAWTHSDEVVAAAQRRVDRARHDTLRAAHVASGVDPVRADLLATLALSVLAGAQQLGSGADVPTLHQLLAEIRPAPIGGWPPMSTGNRSS